MHVLRKLDFDLLLLEAKYYPALRNFFQAVRTGDEQQILISTIRTVGQQLGEVAVQSAWLLFVCSSACLSAVARRDAPQWMHAVANARLPTYDDKTNAVLLYSETNVTVVATDKTQDHGA